MLEFSAISSSRVEEMLRGIGELEVEMDAGGKQDFRYALRKFRKNCENFARIAKISLCTFFR